MKLKIINLWWQLTHNFDLFFSRANLGEGVTTGSRWLGIFMGNLTQGKQIQDFRGISKMNKMITIYSRTDGEEGKKKKTGKRKERAEHGG